MEDNKEARSSALKLLVRSERSESGLRMRLLKKGFTKEQAEDAILYVKERGYQSDRRYAAEYIFAHKEYKSRRWMQYMLLQEGIAEEDIENAFADAEPYSERPAAERYVRKRMRAEAESVSRDLLYSIRAYLVRNGFERASIDAVLAPYEDKIG